MVALRKGALLVGVVLGMLFAAPGIASAQESEVIVGTESGGACDPCEVHIEGESQFARPDGMVMSICADEYTARIYADGTGEIEWTSSPHPSGTWTCNTVNCSSPGSHMPINGIGETAAGQAHLDVSLCFNEVSCYAEMDIVEAGSSHDYEFSMHQRCAHPILPYFEVQGTWETEASPHSEPCDPGAESETDIEIQHV